MSDPVALASRRPRSPFGPEGAGQYWGRKDGRAIYRCSATGALFFAREDIEDELYQDYYPYLEDFDTARFSWELRIRRSKYRRQLKRMEQFVEGQRLLDIGAGPGYLCRVAAEEGWDAWGVEIARDAVKAGQDQFQVRYVPLEEVESGSMDVVTCHHVLEHIRQPSAFLRKLRDKLKIGGLLVIHVPHQQPFTFAVRDRWLRLLGREDERFCTLYGGIHVSGFTMESLTRTVEAHGFSVYQVRTAGMWTMYYDPFFLGNYVRDRAWLAATRKFVRHVVDTFGTPFGMGAWVVGYFYKK